MIRLGIRPCLAVAWLRSSIPSTRPPRSTKSAIERSLDAQFPRIDALYKDIHTHPELGFRKHARPLSSRPSCGVERTAKPVAMMSAVADPEIKITAGAKAVINDDALAARSGAVLKAAFGSKAQQLTEPRSASEDYYLLVGVC